MMLCFGSLNHAALPLDTILSFFPGAVFFFPEK